MLEEVLTFPPKAWAYMKGLFSAPHRLERLERLVSEREFDNGAEQLKARHHIDRIRGVIMLDKLAREQPAKFHVDVMDIFGAWLVDPPRYTGEHPHAWQTNIHSPDTLRIIRAIVTRTDEQMQAEKAVGYEFRLSENSPFRFRDATFYFDGECLVGDLKSAGES